MKNKLCEQLFYQHNPDKIIKILSPYLSDHRKSRIDAVIQHRLNSITLAIENPADINNALACVRTSEALGLSTVHIISPEHDARYINPITQCAFYWVDIVFHDTFESFLKMMKVENRIIAGAVVNAEKTVSTMPIEKPLCILIGNEKRGLSDQAKKACNILFTIPICGMIDSLNLSVAAAIALFDVTQRKRSALQNQTDLSAESAQQLRAKYYLNSVEVRLATQLLKSSHTSFHYP